jgi:ribosomal peptide maturation radical SAM protein 1
MPWATTGAPSIALGILTAICRENDVEVSSLYPNFDTAVLIDGQVYDLAATERNLFGILEHIFAVDIYGRDDLNSDSFLDGFIEMTEAPAPFNDTNFLRHLRDEVVPTFLEQLVERILQKSPTVVGLTATFNQVMSGLALAARLKKKRGELQIIAGGACYDDEMGREYHRAVPQLLDHVFVGEAEEPFREYLRRLIKGRPTDEIPGVTYWTGASVRMVANQPLHDLSVSPLPDYSDYFAERERIQQQTGKTVTVEYVPFESARGCWWGEKNHCVFCGINRDLISFRAKEPNRVVNDLVQLSARFGVVKFLATDWILSQKNRVELFKLLIELDLDLELFYEVRPAMKKWEVQMMRDAGVRRVQPGIESFSTPLLRLMRKNTTGAHQIQFLRWCKEVGIHVSYNLLAGFPGEETTWYLQMANMLRKIGHLDPPIAALDFVELHRFSPLFSQQKEFGIEQYNIRCDFANNFPEGTIDYNKSGYFFEYSSDRLVDRDDYANIVRSFTEPWINSRFSSPHPAYEYRIGAGFVQITDTRFSEQRVIHLQEIYQDVFLLCDEVKTRRSLSSDLAQKYPKEVSDGTLDRIIDELVDDDILFEEGRFLVTLPIAHHARSTEALRGYVLGEAAEETTANAAIGPEEPLRLPSAPENLVQLRRRSLPS